MIIIQLCVYSEAEYSTTFTRQPGHLPGNLPGNLPGHLPVVAIKNLRVLAEVGPTYRSRFDEWV
jgi:hypothetical protein